MTKVEMTDKQIRIVRRLLEKERDCLVKAHNQNSDSCMADIRQRRVKEINELIASMVLDFLMQGGNARLLTTDGS